MNQVQKKAKKRQAKTEQGLKRVIGQAPTSFSLSAEVLFDDQVLAADGEEGSPKLRRFSMVGYTGGKMDLGGWAYPVVVDLAGLSAGRKSRPIFLEHNRRDRVGHTDTIQVDDGKLHVGGLISSTSTAAAEVVQDSDNGFPWQASIGARVRKVVFVPEGKTAKANGKEFAGPVYIARKTVLGEVSFVALGADDNTSATVAANQMDTSFIEEEDMDFTAWLEKKGFVEADLTDAQKESLKAAYEAEMKAEAVDEDPEPAPRPKPEPAPAPVVASLPAPAPEPAPEAPTKDEVDVEAAARAEAESAVKAERDRVSAVQALCAGEFPEIEAQAIRDGWGLQKASEAVLGAIRESRPSADVQIAVRDAKKDQSTLEAALCMRVGIDEEGLVKAYGEEVVEAARADRNISLKELIVEAARMEGVTIPRTFCNDSIRAGFSTMSLPGILSNVANKRLLKSFENQPVIATKLCSEGELNDFKESERYRLTDVGDLEPIAADGELKHGGLTEERATNQLDTFGKTFSLTRKIVLNDDLGAFMKVPEAMGARAARKIDQLFFKRLLSNPGNLFSVSHKNYMSGIDSALSADSLAEASQMFLDQVDADKQPINVAPRYLLVPTSLKMTARELLHSVTYIATGDTDRARIPTYNALADEDLTIVVSPYLANSQYPGASQLAWYLFADPRGGTDTFEIGYLKGQRTPTVEKGETDFNVLGMQFRVYFDLGVREQDHRGVLKSKGEA